ncbi:MAG: P-II family nitrogen regulator [Rhodospirillaceae bacterium]
MKLIKAFLHHVRAPKVVAALGDAGFRNVTLQDVKGMLKPLSPDETEYSRDTNSVVISEARLSLVCEDAEVDTVTRIIETSARIGSHISGWIYVSPVERMIPIGGPQPNPS